ncbi:MAG: hypothetical protein WKF57_12780 [Nakamurella sp.]
MTSPSDQIGRRMTATRTRPEVGDLGAISRDNKGLAACHARENLSSMVAKIPDGH